MGSYEKAQYFNKKCIKLQASSRPSPEGRTYTLGSRQQSRHQKTISNKKFVESLKSLYQMHIIFIPSKQDNFRIKKLNRNCHQNLKLKESCGSTKDRNNQ
jgi:hypothetical protein